MLRPARRDDLPAICDLINRGAQHDQIPQVLTLTELDEQWTQPFVDFADDTRIAELDGSIVGWACVWNPPAEERQENAYLWGQVDPARLGEGIGRTLLAWSIERGRARLQGRAHDLPRFLRVDAYEWVEANQRLFARFGFTPVRWFEELLRPVSDPPVVLTAPGVVLQAWPDDRDEELRAVKNTAFADHWGSVPTSEELWQSWVRGEAGRPDLSVVATDEATGDVIGLCLNSRYPEDEGVTGRREAWIATLATLAPWRGRGLASSMIAWSLRAFADAGLTHAMIGVDADSPTGAARLYRNLGFEPLHRSIAYAIQVDES